MLPLSHPQINPRAHLATPKTAKHQDALEPGFHCVRTHWIPGSMAFQLARRIETVMLMVPVRPESGFG